MTQFDPTEIAKVVVRGIELTTWETVWVQNRAGEAWDEFKFTMAEPPTEWAAMQYHPGDDCTIWLAGQVAITGSIVSRSVSYDGTSHAVQLYGKTRTAWASKSSAYTKTGAFEDKTFMEIAKEVWAPYPDKVIALGTPVEEKQHGIQIQHGETNWDFLERIARPLGAILSTNFNGEIVVVWPHQMNNVGALIEGVNILKCQALMTEDVTLQRYIVTAQCRGTDEKNGKDASELGGPGKGEVQGTQPHPSMKLTPAEGPLDTDEQCKFRAANDMRWHETARIEVNITVQGWINPENNLIWRPGDSVTVVSPMIPLDSKVLGIKSATFTQDSRSGTLTLLELWQPERLNGNGFSLNRPTIDHVIPPPISLEDVAKRLADMTPQERIDAGFTGTLPLPDDTTSGQAGEDTTPNV